MNRHQKVGLTDHSDVLEAMKACRAGMVRLMTAYPFRSAIYREASAMTRELDDLAFLITGEKNYFLPPGHST